MTLSEEVRNALITKGATIIGFADLTEVSEQKRMGFNYGISIATAIDPLTISQINDGPTKEYYNEFKRLNSLLDDLADYSANILQNKGYRAFPLTNRNVVVDEANWSTILPHKTVATLAGMGWIGKCAVLVNQQFGSAIRITSILTDAPLETAIPIKESKCGNCSICTEVCPGNAVKGINWSTDLERESYYDAFSCRKEARKRTAKLGFQLTLCGLCVYSCPYTQKYIKSRLK